VVHGVRGARGRDAAAGSSSRAGAGAFKLGERTTEDRCCTLGAELRALNSATSSVPLWRFLLRLVEPPSYRVPLPALRRENLSSSHVHARAFFVSLACSLLSIRMLTCSIFPYSPSMHARARALFLSHLSLKLHLGGIAASCGMVAESKSRSVPPTGWISTLRCRAERPTCQTIGEDVSAPPAW
jgi:hypothetical protein